MPNHITNWVAFKGDRETLSAIEDAIINKKLFNTFCPPPAEMTDPDTLRVTHRWSRGEEGRKANVLREELRRKYGYENALDWQSAKWSTKWDIYHVTKPVRVSDELLLAQFDTAWSMPLNGLEAVAERTRVNLFCVSEDEGGWPVNGLAVTCDVDSSVAQTFRTPDNDRSQAQVTHEVARAAGEALGWSDVIPQLEEAFGFSVLEEDEDEDETLVSALEAAP